jgi:hypothetical protein
MIKMSAIEYQNNPNALIVYTDQTLTFQSIEDDELEEFYEKKKIRTPREMLL